MDDIFKASSEKSFLKKVIHFNSHWKKIESFDIENPPIKFINDYIKNQHPFGLDIILFYLFYHYERSSIPEGIDIDYVKFLYEQTLYAKYKELLKSQSLHSDVAENFLTKYYHHYGLNLSNDLLNLKRLKIKLNQLTQKSIEYNDEILNDFKEFKICFNNISKILNIKLVILNSFFGTTQTSDYQYQYINFDVLKNIKIFSPIFINKGRLINDFLFFKTLHIPKKEIDLDIDRWEFGDGKQIILIQAYGINAFRLLSNKEQTIFDKIPSIDIPFNKTFDNLIKNIEFMSYTQCKKKCTPYKTYKNIFDEMGELGFIGEMFTTFSLTANDLVRIENNVIDEIQIIQKRNIKKISWEQCLEIYMKQFKFDNDGIMMLIKCRYDKIIYKLREQYLTLDIKKQNELLNLLTFLIVYKQHV